MKHILFVDDEPKVLEGLERLLFTMADQWDMAFVTSGEEALAHFAAAPVDVVISDMRMPGMDGATLLTKVQQAYPKVVRIVLSGHTELETALRAVPVAHQFLTKPCEPELLEEVVERAFNLQSLLTDPRLRQAIGGVDTLPTRPSIYSQLLELLSDPDTGFDKLSAVVEQDVAMCAKVLQLVNSAFFGLRRQVTGIRQAMSYLGITMVKNLVLSVEVFRAYEGRKLPPGFSLDEEQAHTLLTGNIAKRLLEDKRAREDAFMAGMLHDIGKLVLAAHLPEKLTEVMATMKRQKVAMHVAEEDLLGVTHAEIGAYLLGLWGLPYPVVEAVAHHHCPQHAKPRSFDTLGAVYVANHLAHEVSTTRDGETEPSDKLDPTYLEELGVAEQLVEWRQVAKDCAMGG